MQGVRTNIDLGWLDRGWCVLCQPVPAAWLLEPASAAGQGRVSRITVLECLSAAASSFTPPECDRGDEAGAAAAGYGPAAASAKPKRSLFSALLPTPGVS